MIWSAKSKKFVKYTKRFGKRPNRIGEDLTGKQIGNFLILSRAGRYKFGGTLWNVRCVCGKEKQLSRQNIRNMLSCGCHRVERRNDHAHVAKRLYRYALERSKARNIDFNLTLSDISIPAVCPLLGIPIDLSASKNSPNLPSLDRKDSSIGYLSGNVWVVSYRANNLKNNGTLEEFKTVVAGMERACLK